MVLTHTTTHTYAHPFPTVTLAYFLRYASPQVNPFAAHVLSTDTISSRVDDASGRLYTTRIHLKKSRMPAAVFKLLPSSMTGGGSSSSSSKDGVGGSGDRASYILETSVVDIREGWMRTESRNLNWTGVLSVVEKQEYRSPRRVPTLSSPLESVPSSSSSSSSSDMSVSVPLSTTVTDVATTVIFRSRLGEKLRGLKATTSPAQAYSPPAPTPSEGWLVGIMGGWGVNGIQRTIESLASKKTKDQLGKSREGMRVVLERLRTAGGLKGFLELTRGESITS